MSGAARPSKPSGIDPPSTPPPAAPVTLPSVSSHSASKLKGGRRSLGIAMTKKDIDEIIITGSRLDSWLERYVLLCKCIELPHVVEFVSERPDEECTVTFFDLSESSDPQQILPLLIALRPQHAFASLPAAGEDLRLHVVLTQRLTQQLTLLCRTQTRAHAQQAHAQLCQTLSKLNSLPYLSTYLEKYPNLTSGVHVLDCLYAPVLYRVHTINEYRQYQMISLNQEFPVLQRWLRKLLCWTQFRELDCAAMLVLHCRHAGAQVFSEPFSSEPMDWALHSKYGPACALRRQRLLICTKEIECCDVGGQRDNAIALVSAILEAESRALHDVLPSLSEMIGEALRTRDRLLSDSSDGSLWKRFCKQFESAARSLSMEAPAMMLNDFTLEKAWGCEWTVYKTLKERKVVDLFAIAVQNSVDLSGKIELVHSLAELIQRGHGKETTLRYIMQALYREISPNQWHRTVQQVPDALGMTLVKENWEMHFKFGGVALLAGVYHVLKELLKSIHELVVNDGPSNLLSDAEKQKQMSELRKVSKAVHDKLIRMATLIKVQNIAAREYLATFSSLFPSRMQQKLKERGKSLFGFHNAVMEHFQALRSETENSARMLRHFMKLRKAWKRLKKECVLHWRTEKKLLLPTLMLFVPGEDLETLQMRCLRAFEKDQSQLFAVLQSLVSFGSAAQIYFFFNVLRFKDTQLFRHCVALLAKNMGPEQAFWKHIQPLSQKTPQWSLHPKYAAIPFIFQLANRVLLADLQRIIDATQRSLKGLGRITIGDCRSRLEKFASHFDSHKVLIRDTLLHDKSDAFGVTIADVRRLNELLVASERVEDNERRAALEIFRGRLLELLSEMSTAFDSMSSIYVPRVCQEMTYSENKKLLSRVVHLYHSNNPQLLSRTIEALQQDEYPLFCRNIQTLNFPLMKEVIHTLRAELPTRMWLNITDTMPTLSAVGMDRRYWATHPNYPLLPVLWICTHRFLEVELAELISLFSGRGASTQKLMQGLGRTQQFILHLEKHSLMEDQLMLPLLISKTNVMDLDELKHEHALLETYELRLISIVRSMFRSLKTTGAIQTRAISRMKRQLRSFQTLFYPHMLKEEERYAPLLLDCCNADEMQHLFHGTRALYGEELMDASFLVKVAECAQTTNECGMILSLIGSFCLAGSHAPSLTFVRWRDKTQTGLCSARDAIAKIKGDKHLWKLIQSSSVLVSRLKQIEK